MIVIKSKYIAEDQYGNRYWIKEHPRKELMEKMGYSSAEKLFQYDDEGVSWHVGYKVGPHWFTLYHVSAYAEPIMAVSKGGA